MLDETQKRGRKYDDVVNGAKQVFLDRGFEGASMDEIARAAGVSKATLYSYFDDKTALYMAVARSKYVHQIELAQGAMGNCQSAQDCLKLAAKTLVYETLTEFSRSTYRIAMGEASRFPEIAQEGYDSGPGAIVAALTPYLQEGVRQGELVIEDVELSAHQFLELCKADLVGKFNCGQRDSFSDAEKDKVAEEAVKMFMARYGA